MLAVACLLNLLCFNKRVDYRGNMEGSVLSSFLFGV